MARKSKGAIRDAGPRRPLVLKCGRHVIYVYPKKATKTRTVAPPEVIVVRNRPR